MDLTPQDFGARADGVAKDTAAVQAAIDAAGRHSSLVTRHSSHVTFPPGTYLCGALRLRSGVELRLERGARLLASPDIADFPDWPDAKHVVAERCARARSAAFIFADECENIAITGEGVIDGNGEHHVRRRTEPDWIGCEFERIYPMEQSLPRVVFFAGCRDVRVEGVSLVNGPAGWGWWIHDCDRVTMRGLTIRSDVRYPNNDGIHVNCSRDVEISGCDIECGDDALVIRANSRSLAENRPCERVHAHDCRVRSWASGIRVGWCNDGVIRDCSFRRISMRDTTNGIDIVLPALPDNPDYGREATLIEDILFEDIGMDGIYCHPLDAKIESDPRTRVEAVRRVTLRRVRARALEGPNVIGRADASFRDFLFEDCHFEAIPEEAIDSGAVAWGGTIPARDWRRHGAAYAGRTHPARFEGHEGFRFARCEGAAPSGAAGGMPES